MLNLSLMHGSSLFAELSLVVVVGSLVALIMHRFRQPLIIGHILTGIIVGPTLLNIVHNESAFGVFGNIGVALLLFVIGLELNLRAVFRLGKVIASTTLIQVAVTTVAGAFVANWLGFTGLEGFIVGLSLALSSTIIIVKILNDKKELTRLYAQIVVGVLILQDVVATVGKVYLSAQGGGESSVLDLTFLLVRGVLVSGVLYLSSKELLPKLNKSLGDSRELMMLFALGWGFGFAILFEKVGFSLEIGALLAGISMGGIGVSHEISARLKPLRDFFIVIFFIVLGLELVPANLLGVLVPALILSLVVVVLKPISVLASLGLSGYTKRASFKSAVALGQVSEFSLIFLYSAVGYGLASEKAKATITLVAIFSFVASTYMMKYDDQLFELLEPKLKLFERRITKLEQPVTLQSYPIILLGYRKGGAEFIRTFKKMKKRFVVVDYDPEVIEMLERQQLNLLYGDVGDPEIMEELQVEKAKLVVSTISDFATNELITKVLKKTDSKAVLICSADSTAHAAELYELGADYVMLPHFIGSEKIGSFLQRSGLSKLEFKKFRQKHIEQIVGYTADEEPEALNDPNNV